jgi:hypothetical protein
MNQQEKDAEQTIAENVQNTVFDIMLPVIEKSVILAAEYAKACGRDIILPEDMEYSMKYCVMNEVGKDVGSVFPEIYEDESEEECEDDVFEDDTDVSFIRYSGREYKFVKVNMAYDNWDTWQPRNPSEQLLKNAIDSNEYSDTKWMDDES